MTGCQTNGDAARTAATVAGGVVGGVVGSRFGGGAGKLVAVGVGTLVGAIIGNQIASYLTEADQKTAQAAAIQTASTGQTIRWNGNGTGVTGETKVGKQTTERQTTAIPVYKERVKTMPPLDLVGETYEAKAKTIVRGGPATNYVEVDSLKAGEAVTVVGKVKGTNWALVSDGAAASGFVPLGSLKAATQTAAAPASTKSAPKATVEVAKVEAETDCKTIDQTVTLTNGEKKTDSVTVCRGPDGWSPKA
ncbi:glycine zipper 2TM domain-containing protein [Azospirillum soli]|uniref:glycine zipper 2TM domain-containing protein n=1 Tax=Azospirillum soli TaxID=1304799 RepID=UPI001AE4E409|nr:glycine zipper 2TM domain-containing protein [Azospirillum soli]MBP2315554.1 surface antigen [Azospirillum soli]